MSERDSQSTVFTSNPRCRFNCSDPAVFLVEFDEDEAGVRGCLCYADRIQALCAQHWQTCEPLVGVRVIARLPFETECSGWIACGERMPAHGLKVMGYFMNKLGKGRTVFAHHFEYLKERADNYEIDSDTPEDWFDMDESGESYVPAGWYENSETHEQELGITDEILFWRPMLAAPEQVKTTTEGQ